jgi:hypothetical protein
LLEDPQIRDDHSGYVQPEVGEEVHSIERSKTRKMRIVLKDGKMFPIQDGSEEDQENNMD